MNKGVTEVTREASLGGDITEGSQVHLLASRGEIQEPQPKMTVSLACERKNKGDL